MRASSLLVVSVGLVSLAAGCSDDDGVLTSGAAAAPEATVSDTIAGTTAAATVPAPTDPADAPRLLYNGPLQAATYVGNQFEHPVTLTVDEGWEALESFRSILLLEVLAEDSALPEGGGLAILDNVSDLSIDEVIAEFAAVEGFSFSEPEPTTIAGLDGVTFVSDPLAEDADFHFIRDSQGWFYTPAGMQSEVHVVDAPTGTRLIVIEALPEGWDSFRARAQSVIDTIVWAE
jgi:hypothetical protein